MLIAITLHYGHYHDINCSYLSCQDKENIFGTHYETYMMGLRSDKANRTAFPRMFENNQSSIIRKQAMNSQRVFHFLFSLPGHIGSGISIELVVVCLSILQQLLTKQLLNI